MSWCAVSPANSCNCLRRVIRCLPLALLPTIFLLTARNSFFPFLTMCPKKLSCLSIIILKMFSFLKVWSRTSLFYYLRMVYVPFVWGTTFQKHTQVYKLCSTTQSPCTSHWFWNMYFQHYEIDGSKQAKDEWGQDRSLACSIANRTSTSDAHVLILIIYALNGRE